MLYKSNKIEAINIQESCSNIIPIFPEESFTMPKLYEYGKGNKGVCFSPYKVKVSACNLYIIPKGKILVNREEVFTQDNKVVQEITSQRINPFIDQPSTSLKNPKVIRGKVLHLSLSGLENNYYHFTVEFLARWYLWLCSGIEYDWITFPLKNSFHLDCANLLGIDLNKILPSENLNCIKADEILIPSMINNWNLVYYKSYPHALKMFLPSWLTQCHSLIRTRNNQFSSNNIQKLQDIKRIYISRKKASYRYVLNENNLSDVFVKYQISPVILEDLSLTEQIILFSDLEIVISPHGAGLVNISYSQNSTKILEIYPYNYHDSSFRIHAKVFGHHYDYLIGEKPQDESLKPSYENIYIDTNRIDKWLSENVSHDILLGHFKDLKRNMEVEESLLIIPIVFLIFNRPDTTARVFETIRQAKPPKLLIVADGPRSDRPDDIENCKAARAIVEKIDWDCEVFRNYSEVNLGCRKRVISGLDWVFEQVEEAIILEDDCLPHPTFFRYCQELLEKYRNDTRIMMISGDNFQFGRNKTEHSYYFSRYGHIWGWATWRRSWLLFDESMSTWPERRDQKWLEQLLGNEQAAVFWTRIFQGVYDGFNTWDYIWIFTLWSHNGLTILPNINLISNIGFGSGTHTTMQNSPFANMKIASMPFPLVHPNLIQQNIEADNFTELTQFSQVDLSRQENRSVQCKICGGNSYYFANAQILQKYDVSYFQCSVCKFVQTEEPYWLEEAYSKAIASSDVGLVYRNILMADITAKILYNFFDHNASFLDYGGGYGLFVRLMRDKGFDFYWEDKYCDNIFAQGFEFNSRSQGQILLVTAFELFEHFPDPVHEIEKMLEISSNILFSTQLLPQNNPKPSQWWYFTPHEGQHISIFTKQALEFIAQKYNLNLYSDNSSLHLLTNQLFSEDIFKKIENRDIVIPSKNSLLSNDYQKIVKSIIQQEKIINTDSLCSPLIVVDGVFFQMYSTGIARVWRSLLEEWAKTDFAKHILVLDRGGNSVPKIDGIKYRSIPLYDYGNTEADKQMLQEICNQENADLFISTYYTTPLETPSVFMAYDMIPEVTRANLEDPMWREKHHAIQHASGYISISGNTADDLSRSFTGIDRNSITVAHCGVSSNFYPAHPLEKDNFKFKYGIHKPFFLLGNLKGYKNGILFFQAFQELINRHQFDIVCTGAGSQLPNEWRGYTSGCTVHNLYLSDDELRLAYSAAIALVYPSKYEGFGMPILEAMACGCPVITTRNASIPEVAGQAALYVNDDNIGDMADALYEVQKPRVRRSLIDAGLAQAQQFSWKKMANIIQEKLFEVASKLDTIKTQSISYLMFPDWEATEDELEQDIASVFQQFAPETDRSITLLIDITDTTEEEANLFLSSVAMNLMMEEELEVSENLNFSFLQNLSETEWDTLLPNVLARIQLDQENVPDLEAIESLPVISARQPNYLICPDWNQEDDRLAEDLTQTLKHLAEQEDNAGACVLIDISDMDAETIGLYLSELMMTVLLNEGIDLNDFLNISLIGDLIPDQLESLQSVSRLISLKGV